MLSLSYYGYIGQEVIYQHSHLLTGTISLHFKDAEYADKAPFFRSIARPSLGRHAHPPSPSNAPLLGSA